MDADGPALLRQPDDVLLDLLAGGHHHVGDLVGDHDDERHRRGDRRRLLVGLRADPLDELVAAQRVVAGEVADAHLRQEGVALLHLLHRPGKDRLRLLHVGDDRVHEMGERLVRRQLDHLRVDHQHSHLVRAAGHDDREDERVETHALPRAGPTGDEEMGQRGHVDDHRIARHVLAEEQRDLQRLRLGLCFLHHLPEADHLPGRVGNLDADRVLAGDRGDDPDARHAQGDRQIVGEVDDLRQAQARLELDLVLRNDRAGLDLDDADLESELGEGLFEHPRPFPHLVLLLVLLQMLRGEEKLERGELVVGPDRTIVDIHLHRPPPAGQRLDRHLRGHRCIDRRRLRCLVVIGLVEAILDVVGLECRILGGGPSRGLSNLDRRAQRIGIVAGVARRIRLIVLCGSAADRLRRTAACLPPRRLGRSSDRRDGSPFRRPDRRLAATKQRGTRPDDHAPDAGHEGRKAQQCGVADEKQPGGRDPADDDRRPRVGEQAFGEQSTSGADGAPRPPHGTGERVGEEHRQKRGGADRGDDGADGAERQIGKDAATQQADIERRNKGQADPRGDPEPAVGLAGEERTDRATGVQRPGIRREGVRIGGIGGVEGRQGCQHERRRRQEHQGRDVTDAVARRDWGRLDGGPCRGGGTAGRAPRLRWGEGLDVSVRSISGSHGESFPSELYRPLLGTPLASRGLRSGSLRGGCGRLRSGRS